ncbi:MAG: tetratricopeptide repeat protein [Tepidisphaeraceae bacterium]|jgi:predicted O-linked N-acetylglucosamine transferase (SPINDLY family)
MSDSALDLAKQHHHAGRLSEAQAAYREALSQNPDNAAIFQLLGIVTCQLGDLDAGVQWLNRAVAAAPLVADYHCNLGSALAKQNQFQSAVATYRRALELNPNYPEAYSNLAEALNELGQFDEAVAMSRRALALRPNYAAPHHSLGRALRSLGDLDEAIACFKRAVELQPKFVEAVINLAAVQAITGQADAAADNYRRAIELRDNSFEAWNGLAAILVRRGRWKEAADAGRCALQIRPEDPDAAVNLSFALQGLQEIDSALALWSRVSKAHPEVAAVHNGLGNALQAAGDMAGAVASYSRAAELDPTGDTFQNNYLYGLYFLADCKPEFIAGEHRRWNDRYARPLFDSTPHANERDPARRLKIGYVSPDFRNHCQSFFTLPILRNHRRESFEIYLYSSVLCPDDLTQTIAKYADVWRNVAGQSDEHLARQIRQDRIDILVDLTMHMADGRPMLFARKPAPIQMAWLAYPGTTGLSAMDYRLTDPNLDPPHEHDDRYAEKSIRLPDTFWCYDPLTRQEVSALPALNNGYVTFGCLNNFCKVTDHTLSLWSTILKSAPHSRLILLSPQGEHRRRVLGKLDVQPQRVEFIPYQSRDKYLQTYHRIDLCLDTFPYNGHTTSLDSFWMGVPVISVRGESPVSRAVFSQTTNLGLADQFVAATAEEFCRMAVDWSAQLPRLAELRSSLRQRMEKSPLMDGPRFALNIEAVYRQVWRQWCGANRVLP